jgi:peptidoglycan hydrolase-like protein with peptidoglycan-binding domain
MTGEPTLRYGDHEADGWVKYLQEKLQVEDDKLVATGVFDDPTLAAVQAFQAHRQLSFVDGIVGDETWAALRSEEHHAPGVDGLPAHEHVDLGLHLVFYNQESDDLYFPDYDTIGAAIVNVGSTQCYSGVPVHFTLTKENGEVIHPDIVLTVPQGPDPAQPGDTQWCQITDAKHILGTGTHHVEIRLSDAVGGETKKFSITIP